MNLLLNTYADSAPIVGVWHAPCLARVQCGLHVVQPGTAQDKSLSMRSNAFAMRMNALQTHGAAVLPCGMRRRCHA